MADEKMDPKAEPKAEPEVVEEPAAEEPEATGGTSFDYGQVDEQARAEQQGNAAPVFDPDNPGGQSFDYGQRPEE